MKLTELFTKTIKDVPAGEVSKNAQLLIRAGFVHKEIAGVYTWLPLGLKVLENVCQIIREEMDAVGGQEMKLTTLQDPSIWETTDRWDDDKVDVWFKTRLKNGSELGLGPTHEEPLVRAASQFINSYKDLPFLAYQIQTKFRNETRAKSGVLRGREFLMKDMYSFARTEAEHEELYEKIKQAYFKIFERLGIGEQTFLTFASGGMFSQFSHEFQTVCDAGEDKVYLSKSKQLAVNEEVMNDEVLNQLELKREELEEVTAAEVGNIFTLKDKFSKPLGLNFTDQDGKEHPVLMGCYGIGPSRLVGVIVELLADDQGMVWPEAIAPSQVHIVSLHREIGDDVHKSAEALYQKLQAQNVDVIWDDRLEVRAGEKFADADLFGVPHRVTISAKTVEAEKVEYKMRTAGDATLLSESDLLAKFS